MLYRVAVCSFSTVGTYLSILQMMGMCVVSRYGYYNWCCYDYSHACLSINVKNAFLLGMYLGAEILGCRGYKCSAFGDTTNRCSGLSEN